MVVIVRNGAKRQIREIFDYYRTVANRKVAKKIVSKISETIDLLTVHPHIGAFCQVMQICRSHTDPSSHIRIIRSSIVWRMTR